MTISDKKDLKLLLIAAREAQITAEKSVSRVYEKIHSAARGNLIDLDRPTRAENARTLEEAINCHIDYGEFNLDDLADEIEEAIDAANEKGDDNA